ncbi:MAG: hypothetical protein JWN30_1006 [Bacilli bacterium]|nr:hypothetical protein [Bacilli bacterium]
MNQFEDWDQKLKKTFNATSNVVVLTVTEAGHLLGLSKDEMKVYVVKHQLTKVPIMRSVHRYLLLKSEIDNLVGNVLSFNQIIQPHRTVY